MTTALQIDFVSDVACPWCAVGLYSLDRALERLKDEVQVHIEFQPFELNPDMPPGGEDLDEPLSRKYGSSPAQLAQSRRAIVERGAEVGFAFRPEGRGRVYNTFDAHRLLCWAAAEGPQGAQKNLKQSLLQAYQGRAECIESPEVLLACVAEAGLPIEAAREVLAQGRYAEEVRMRERLYQQAGIHSVPAIIINQRHLISGGQPVEVFEQALREIAAGLHDAPAQS